MQIYIYIYKNQIFEWIFAKYMERIKDIYIIQQIFFSFTNDFDSSGGRVMKFSASGHRSLFNQGKK